MVIIGRVFAPYIVVCGEVPQWLPTLSRLTAPSVLHDPIISIVTVSLPATSTCTSIEPGLDHGTLPFGCTAAHQSYRPISPLLECTDGGRMIGNDRECFSHQFAAVIGRIMTVFVLSRSTINEMKRFTSHQISNTSIYTPNVQTINAFSMASTSRLIVSEWNS